MTTRSHSLDRHEFDQTVKCFVRETNRIPARGGNRPLCALVSALFLAGTAAMSSAMGTPPRGLTAQCQSESAKQPLPEGLCALFIDRLAAAYPDRAVRQGDSADLQLVVLRAGSGLLVARLDVAGQSGVARGTGRRGAPLDAAALARFLDALIAATPLP